MKSLFETLNYHDEVREAAKHFIENVGLDFYRGTDVEGHVPFRFRSAPRDTFRAIHNQVNRETQERFGLPLRNLTFATMSRTEASQYGMPKSILPLGDDYRIFYNPDFHDMTIQMEVKLSDIERDMTNALRRPIDEVFPDEVSTELQGLVDDGFVNDIVKAHFVDPQHETYRVGIEAMKSDVFDYLTNTVPEEYHLHLNALFEKCTAFIESDMQYVEQELREYVTGMIEVTGPISDIDKEVEFMIYAPQGFLVGGTASMVKDDDIAE